MCLLAICISSLEKKKFIKLLCPFLKKAEHRGTDAFELCCWRRLLRVSWTARRSNQSILKETSPGCSLEGLMLRLKLQYLSHLMWRADSLEKTLMPGGIEGRRIKGTTEDEMAGWHDRLYGHEFGWTPGVGDGQGGLACCNSWGRKELDMTEQLNWTVIPTAISEPSFEKPLLPSTMTCRESPLNFLVCFCPLRQSMHYSLGEYCVLWAILQNIIIINFHCTVV